MKVGLRLLLHVAAIFAGFWVASSEHPIAQPSPVKKTTVERVAKSKEAPFPPMPRHPLTRAERLEKRLTPQQWREVLIEIDEASIKDLSALLKVTIESRYPDVRDRVIDFLFTRWTELDRDSALAALKTITSPQLKETALSRILFEWAKTDVAAAWKWVASMEEDPVQQEIGLESLLANGAETDPLGYAAWAAQIEDPFLRCKALDQIATTWGRGDPKGAFAAALEMNDPMLRRRLLTTVCYRDESGIDRAQAMDLILQMADQAERIELLSDNWIGAIARDTPEDALQWLVRHADNPDLQKVGGALGGVLAAQVETVGEPRAMALQLPAGPLRDAFSAQAASGWSIRGGVTHEAMALLSLCGPCIEREDALGLIKANAGKR
jgi:hypothetical protein